MASWKQKPHYSPAQQRRKRTIMRAVLAAISISVLYVLFVAPTSPFGSDSTADTMVNAKVPVPRPISSVGEKVAEGFSSAKMTRKVPTEEVAMEADKKKDPTEEVDWHVEERTKQDTVREKPSPVQREKQMPFEEDDRPVRKAQPAAESPEREHAREGKDVIDSPFNFKRKLESLIALMPDELRRQELLSPIRGTGETRLKDLGLRIRAFTPIYRAWGDLHILSFDGKITVRDDVVGQIRKLYGKESSSAELGDMIRGYESFKSFFTRLSILLFPGFAPYSSDLVSLHTSFQNSGRGIVLTAGDKQAPYLLTSIPSFRRLGCTLPIEIMYLGEDDLSQDARATLEALPGVITRDLSPMIQDDGWTLAGWAAKPYAILMSSFREVIFVDADALFFVNPETLLDDPQYLETGALFFKDRRIMPEVRRKFLKAILPNPLSAGILRSRFWTGDSGHMQESGVVIVDKVEHFIPLLLVTRMNGPDRDGNKDEGRVGTYDLVYGDKETFWLGWELCGDVRYAFHQGHAGIMGSLEPVPTSIPMVSDGTMVDGIRHHGTSLINGSLEEGSKSAHPDPAKKRHRRPKKHTICAPQLLHLDVEGRPLWFNGWLAKNKFLEDEQMEMEAFEYFISETQDTRHGSPWDMRESNICCLSAEKYEQYTVKETETLNMLIEIYKDVNAVRSKSRF